MFVSTLPNAHEASRLSGTVSAGARWRVSGFVVRRRRPNSSTQKRVPPGASYLFSSPTIANGSVDKFLAHHLSVRPLLNGYLAHVERTPLGMIGIDAVNNERLVPGNPVAVANVGSHRFDLRKKVLLESATSCLTNSGRLLIFLHRHVVGVIAVESFQRFSTDDLSNQVLNCRLGGLRTHPNLLVVIDCVVSW